MLNKRTFISLSVVSGVLFTGALLIQNQTERAQTVRLAEPTRLFPQLMDKLNDVSSISIKTASDSFVVTHDGMQWVIPEQANYEVDNGKLKSFLIGVAELTQLEPKTNNPDNFPQIHLQPLSDAHSQATEVRIKDRNGQELAAVLFGKEKSSKRNQGLTEFFVRKPSENNVWLITGDVAVYREANEWLNKSILDIPENTIKQVTLAPYQGTPLVLRKTDVKQENFEIAHLPKNKKVDSSFSVNYIASTLGSLTLEDVANANDITFNKLTGNHATLETFDGIVIRYLTTEHDAKTYVKLEASLKSKSPDSNELTTKIEQLNKKFSKWVFAIPDFQAEELQKQLDELTA